MILKENEILRCPECGGQLFHATAHVTQDWELDKDGEFSKCLNECVEVTHSPDTSDLWNCAVCGYCGPGSEFIVNRRPDPDGTMPKKCLEKKIVLTTTDLLTQELISDLGNGAPSDNGDRCSQYFPIAKGYREKLYRKVTAALIEKKNGLPQEKWHYTLHLINDVDETNCQFFCTEHLKEPELVTLLDEILKNLEGGTL